MSEATTNPSTTMLTAVTDLWRLRPPGPDNILAHPAFERLREACRDGNPNAGKKGPAFAVSTALRALGLPCNLQKDMNHLALPVEEAARGLDAALRATQAKRIHLAPLDLAADLPPLAFGSAKVCRLTADELRLRGGRRYKARCDCRLCRQHRLQRLDPVGLGGRLVPSGL